MNECYIGIDLGGTNIKVGILDENCNILTQTSCKTNSPRSGEALCNDMVMLVLQVLEQSGRNWQEAGYIGIGSPGTINNVTGIVEYSNNLELEEFPMRDCMEQKLKEKGISLPIYLQNDANAAALGEFFAGSAKGANHAVVITLGTGVGSGIIIDSKIYSGFNGAGGEIGHTAIVYKGRECTCGRKGCLEAYASATGLIAATKQAMADHPESLLHSVAEKSGKVEGRTAFDAKDLGDNTAAQVVEEYVGYLACGLANVVNTLQPEVICIGGGISHQGEALLEPLRKKVYSQVFSGKKTPKTKIVACTTGNDAGIIGAAMLGESTISK